MYEKINVDLMNNSGIRIVDLRSDTLSKPTEEMREAMYRAAVGDDVYGEDPTVAELETKAAELLGKEEALFVASGTMANLIAIMVHCNQRGSEIISGDYGHTFKFEQGGTAQIAGVHTAVIKNNDDGTFSIDDLRKKIRKNPDFHEPISSLIIVENTHNLCGGKVIPLEWLEKVHNVAQEYNIPVHMDGARMMNAAVYLKVPPSRIVRDVDSVCFCLSKGLGCPVGAILAGTSSFIAKARRVRKAIGGGWRQAGIIAAAGVVALDTMIDRLQMDHNHAYQIARAIYAMHSNNFRVDLTNVHTNMVLMYVDKTKIPIKDLQRRLQAVSKTDSVKCSVRCMSLNHDCVRFTLYWEITDEDIRMACEKIQLVIREYDNLFKVSAKEVQYENEQAIVGNAISDVNSPYFKSDEVQTNIVNVYLYSNLMAATDVTERLAMVCPTDPVKVSVLCSARDWHWIRIVVYWEITEEDVKAVVGKILFVIKEFEERIRNGSKGETSARTRKITHSKKVKSKL